MKKHPLKTLIALRNLSVTKFAFMVNMQRQVIYRKMISNRWTMHELCNISTFLAVDRNTLIDILKFKKKATKLEDFNPLK